MRLIAAAAAALALTACSLAAPDGETVAFASRSPAFVDALLAGEAAPEVLVRGRLMTPATPPPWGAVVLLHSASGQGAIDWAYAGLLTGEGHAVLAVDSFSPRGVFRTVDDQTLVSEAAMVEDAYRALDLLARDPRIDPSRIAVVGFSKGGIAALYSAFERLRSAAHGRRFAAHAAFYPWCGLRLRDPVTTGAPILVQIGGDDTITPAALCSDLLADVTAQDAAARAELVVYDGARHAFDHPALAGLSWVPVTGMVPGDCRLEEQADGRFVELSTGLPVTGATLAATLTSCGRGGGEAGGDPGAAGVARQRLLAFLAAAIGPAATTPSP